MTEQTNNTSDTNPTTESTDPRLVYLMCLRDPGDYPTGTCVAWMESAERVCAKPGEQLCGRHVKVARARLAAAVNREQVRRAKRAETDPVRRATVSGGFTITDEQRAQILAQIGAGTICSISGGRVTALADGIELPVSSGYRVRVHLTPVDDYTVQRVLVRGGREFAKGQHTGLYCDQVGESAYRAAMFRSYDADQW